MWALDACNFKKIGFLRKKFWTAIQYIQTFFLFSLKQFNESAVIREYLDLFCPPQGVVHYVSRQL